MFAIAVPYMNLDHIYNSGQVSNWVRVDDGIYVVHYKDQVVKIQQKKDSFLLSCTEENFYKYWYDYFDLGTDYSVINNMYKNLGIDFKAKLNRCKGLHIIRQDIFEIIIKCLVKNKCKIDYILGLGKKYKKSVINCGQFKFYDIPTYDIILSKVKEDRYTSKLLKLCKMIDSNEFDLDYLKSLDYRSAGWHLLRTGLFNKNDVRIICLFGLHHLQAFPMNKFLEDMFSKEFDMTYEEWQEWYTLSNKQKENVGYLRQVLMYNYLNPPTRYNTALDDLKKKRKRRL